MRRHTGARERTHVHEHEHKRPDRVWVSGDRRRGVEREVLFDRKPLSRKMIEEGIEG